MEVRLRAGDKDNPNVGFLDTRDIDLGAPWSEELTTALLHSRTFVALCSPSYFQSEYCGKEWALFADRVEQFLREAGPRPPVMFPLVWMARTAMHPAAEVLQHTTERLGERYREDGLRDWMRLRNHRDRRLSFTSTLAELIVSTTYQHEIPPPRVRTDIRLIPNAFSRQKATSGRRSDRSTNQVSTQYVHFVIAAGSRAEMRPLRHDLTYYGGSRQEWAPYQPRLSQSLGAFASAIAAQRKFRAVVDDINATAAGDRPARPLNRLVILLVDAWATRLTGLRQALRRHDSDTPQPAAVMIPLNRHDEETLHHWQVLDYECRVLLENSARGPDPRMYRAGVLTHDDFSAVLEDVLEQAYNRLLATGEVRRLPPRPDVERPILDGP
jgi:FxsC-like protein